MSFEQEIKSDNKRLNEIYDKILADFSKEIYAVEKYNATHGNMYVGGKNYILASQAVKVLKEIILPEIAETIENPSGVKEK